MVLTARRNVLEAMLSRIHVLVAYLDLDFRFVRVNDAYARAGGHPPDFFAGRNHFELYPDEENEAIFRRVRDSGEPFVTFARPFYYRDQPERGVTYWDWTIKRIDDEDGHPCGLIFTLVDVTERERSRLALERSMEDLERLNASLDRLVDERTEQLRDAMSELEAFSYSVSHDLRAPVHAIRGFAELLAESHAGALDPDATRLVQRIRSGAESMSEMIESLLALSQATLAEISREDVDVTAVARQIVAELAEREPHRHVRVRVEDGLHAKADSGLVRILLANLIGNAWKFTASCADAEIEVARGDGASFVVRDNGAGFDMRQASRLFVPFQRLHGNRQFNGTGVGLATVQRIVRRHGGTIQAHGFPNQGATFTFTLGPDA